MFNYKQFIFAKKQCHQLPYSHSMKKTIILSIICFFAFSARAVDFLDADELFDAIDNKSFDNPIVIELWADWCPGSRIVAPRFDTVAREYGYQAQFFKIDIDEYPEVVNYFNVNCLPCVIAVYIGSNEYGEPQVYYTGARGEPYLKAHHIREIVREAIDKSI